ncbi:hypothetical protein SJC03_239 [Bacteroides phage SJC03]|nr:hypothetical protein SJC03_239 [Bacteroides phage SJC03]
MKIDINYEFVNLQGEKVKIIDKILYKNDYKFLCKFEDGTKILSSRCSINKKTLENPNFLVGKVFETKNFEKFLVEEKTDKQNESKSYLYKIKFIETGGIRYVDSTTIKNGIILDKCKPHSLLKIFEGNGIYSIKNNLKVWNILYHISKKCLDKKDKRYKQNGAKGVFVCDEWLNFQNFAKYYYNNIWTNEYKLELDKDILCNIKHLKTKIYSPETCLLIPEEINCWLAGDCLSSGVFLRNFKYRVTIFNFEIKETKISLGTFESFKEAKMIYANEKYKYWKQLLEKYNIPNSLKEILLKYDFSWSWIWENMTEEEIREKYYGSIKG